MKRLIALILLLVIPAITSAQGSSDYVSYKELIRSLDIIATKYLEPSDTLKKEFLELQKTHNINGSAINYRHFVRVRLAFEMTRDSGLWQIRWAVTNKKPNSDSIWKQWHILSNPQYQKEDIAQATAIAECDESSALFAFISRGLGVKNVGLFWPQWNHTVGVWTTKSKQGKPIRIVIPTSQIFISSNASLGTKEFDPYKQKVIYNYSRKDILSNYKIPKNIATMMLNQAKKYGAESSIILQKRRNRLSKKFGGS